MEMGPRSTAGRVLIVGGGITGLSAAYTLSRDAPFLDVDLLEREGRWGGKIVTDRGDGFVIEGGPDSFLASKSAGVGLCRRLGIEDRLEGTDERHRRTFVMRDGRLHPMPEGLTGLVPSRLEPLLQSDLFSPGGKRRLEGERHVAPMRGGDESLASFIERRFGPEAYERLIEPLMAGIYAGDGRALSLLATFPNLRGMEVEHGSILAAMQARPAAPPSTGRSGFLTPRGGMGEMVEAILPRLSATMRLGTDVRSLTRIGGGYDVTTGNGSRLKADAVILAIPAGAAAHVVETLDPDLAALLDGIPYVASATVTLGYRCGDLSHDLDGYGYVIPRGEGRPALACTWVSSKFRHRAPEGHALVRVFVGRAGAEEALRGSDIELLAIAREELRSTLHIGAEPVISRVFRWPAAMPQYNLGHLERLALIESRLDELPGLHVAGAAYRGVGIPDCVAAGEAAAHAVLKRLQVSAAT